MFEFVALGFGIGVVVTAVVAYFVARNNKAKAIELLNVDLKAELDQVLAKTEIDDNIKEFLESIKKKF